MFHYGFGFNGIAHALLIVVSGLFSVLLFSAVVAIAVLLVRFLWFGTLAAKLYVETTKRAAAAAEVVEETHVSPGPVGAPAEPSSAPSSVVPPTAPLPSTAPPEAPPAKPRTPRTPKTPPADKP